MRRWLPLLVIASAVVLFQPGAWAVNWDTTLTSSYTWWNYDYVEFDFGGDPYMPANVPTSATLTLPSYDIDYNYSGDPTFDERDKVWFNGHDLGYLLGYDNAWYTNVFALDPSWISVLSNTVRIQGTNPDPSVWGNSPSSWYGQVDNPSLHVEHTPELPCLPLLATSALTFLGLLRRRKA